MVVTFSLACEDFFFFCGGGEGEGGASTNHSTPVLFFFLLLLFFVFVFCGDQFHSPGQGQSIVAQQAKTTVDELSPTSCV